MTEEEIQELDPVDIMASQFTESGKSYLVVKKGEEVVGYCNCTDAFFEAWFAHLEKKESITK